MRWNQIEHMVTAFETGKLSRRQLVAGLGACVAVVAGVPLIARARDTDSAASTFTALELNHVALNVTDVRRSRDWYSKHLGLKVLSESERNCFMGCGNHFLALFRNREPGLNHYCYTIKNYEPDRVVTKLKDVGLKPRRTENRVYFDDPDGIEVQVSGRNRRPATKPK